MPIEKGESGQWKSSASRNVQKQKKVHFTCFGILEAHRSIYEMNTKLAAENKNIFGQQSVVEGGNYSSERDIHVLL